MHAVVVTYLILLVYLKSYLDQGQVLPYIAAECTLSLVFLVLHLILCLCRNGTHHSTGLYILSIFHNVLSFPYHVTQLLVA